MTAFLQRLLAQNGDTSLPDAVQPRPVARFEGSDGAAWIEETTQQPAPEVGRTVRPQPSILPQSPVQAQERPQIEESQSLPPGRLETVSENAASSQPRYLESVSEPETLQIAERQAYSDIVDLTQQPDSEPAVVQITRVERITPELALLQPETQFLETAGLPPVAAIVPAPEPETPRQISEKPPLVRVSIGRVEVHAATPLPARPSAPRRAPASPKAVRSLDDYLRSRNEGRR